MSSRTPRPATPSAKLLPPRLGRVFERGRLFEVLDGWAGYPGIWVAAAPGAGKSTLVATWLQNRQRPTLWLQVDSGDADPATFVHSLEVLLVANATEPVSLPAIRADDLADLAGWLRRRIRLFLAVLPAQWALVLDNHQELPPDSPLQKALAQAMAELPSGVQWIFVSRERPPAAFSRAMAQQQLALLDADSLRFDTEETLAMTRLHGRPDAMAGALAVAQGWAGGMTLMLLGSPREAKVPGLEARERLFDYFAGEVLVEMSVSDRTALCELAFLPNVTDEMAVALTQHAGAPALLERLAALSLFVDRREGLPPVYVFHALFREFLAKRFETEHSASKLQALQRRCGRMMIDAGLLDEGLQSMIDAQASGDALEVLLEAAPQYVASGRTLALIDLIDRLPEGLRERLSYWRGYCALDTDPESALRDLAQAYAMSVAAGDVDAELLIAAATATALVSLSRLNDLDPWLDVLTRHAVRACVAQPETVEMRLVPGLLAALVYRAPWHPLAEALAERAERLLRYEAAPGQRLLLGALAFHLLWRGHVERLQRILLRIDALCTAPLAAPAAQMRWWSVGITVKCLLGQTSSAAQDAQWALAVVDAEPSVASRRTSVALLQMLVALAAVDSAAARRHQQDAAQALDPDHAVDRTTLEHQLGILALLENDRATALRVMRAAVVSGRASGFPMRQHIALIANALTAAHSGEHAEAERLLAEVFGHPFHADCRWHHWVGGCVAAYAALCRGKQDQALVHLRGALAVARECGFRHGPMLYCCGDMMARLAALALAHGVEPEVARDMVLRNHLKAPAEADAAWPWAVRIHALGRLVIERADGPLPSSRKESRRLMQLAALLVAHCTRPVALDVLVDELWPDSDGDAARNALDNALHRLRKLLGGDDRVVLRQGALSLNPQLCWTDVAAVEKLLAELDGCSVDATAARVSALKQHYRSTLLPHEPLAGVAGCRTALHRRVQRSLRGAADRLATAGRVEAAAEAVAAFESLPNL
jgi:LuxR family transcriptional regulator, maltose regulon positive regulatory protein